MNKMGEKSQEEKLENSVDPKVDDQTDLVPDDLESAVDLNIDKALNEAISDFQEGNTKSSLTPKPIESFEKAGIDDALLKAIQTLNWKTPTKVQSFCLPYTLQGKDVAGFAQTGTGKTGVFLITVAHRILEARKASKKSEHFPFVVILVPTRELAVQIEDSVLRVTKSLRRLSPSLVSLILSKKRRISPDRAEGLATLCNLKGREKQFFI